MGLFEPLWKKQNLKGDKLFKAIDMVFQMEEQEELARVAIETPNKEIFEIALSKIKEQPLLEKVALNITDINRALKTMSLIKDQNILKEIACLEDDPKYKPFHASHLRDKATGMIKDQDFLRSIAFDLSKGTQQRTTAMKQLKSPDDIERFAREEIDHYSRLAALERIDDQSLIESIKASWNEKQKSKTAYEEHKNAALRAELDKKEKARKLLAQGFCPYCGVRLTSGGHNLPDNAIVSCGNCGKRLK